MPNIAISSNIDKAIRHLKGLRDLAPQMMSEVVHTMNDLAAQMADADCPVGLPALEGVGKGGTSGTLKSSLWVDNTKPFMGQFGYAASYSIYVEMGTPPHIIAPKNKDFLAWPIGATTLGKARGKSGKRSQKHTAIEWVYVRGPVQHPGTQPVGWCRKAVEDAQSHLEEIAGSIFSRYADRLQIGGARVAT